MTFAPRIVLVGCCICLCIPITYSDGNVLLVHWPFFLHSRIECLCCEKPSKPRGNLPASTSVYFKGQRPAIVTSGAGRHGWLASNSDTATAVCMCVGVFRRSRGVRAHACACMRPFVRACVREVFAIYDNTI